MKNDVLIKTVGEEEIRFQETKSHEYYPNWPVQVGIVFFILNIISTIFWGYIFSVSETSVLMVSLVPWCLLSSFIGTFMFCIFFNMLPQKEIEEYIVYSTKNSNYRYLFRKENSEKDQKNLCKYSKILEIEAQERLDKMSALNEMARKCK